MIQVRAAGDRHCFHKATKRLVRVVLINPDTRFHRDRKSYRFAHRPNTFGYQRGLGHQTDPKTTAFDSFAGTPDVEIYLVVTRLGSDSGTLGQRAWIAASQLQGKRMFIRVMGEEPPTVAIQYGPGR